VKPLTREPGSPHKHRTTRVRTPRTNGFVERTNRTLLDECFRVLGRTTWLLLASLVFYAWGEMLFTLVMLTAIAANYGFGLWVDRARGTPAARAVLALTVA